LQILLAVFNVVFKRFGYGFIPLSAIQDTQVGRPRQANQLGV